MDAHPLDVLNNLTDVEADNLAVMGQNVADSLSWSVVLHSWLQMPAEVQERVADGYTVAEVDRALLHAVARYGVDASVILAYSAR